MQNSHQYVHTLGVFPVCMARNTLPGTHLFLTQDLHGRGRIKGSLCATRSQSVAPRRSVARILASGRMLGNEAIVIGAIFIVLRVVDAGQHTQLNTLRWNFSDRECNLQSRWRDGAEPAS